VATFKTELQLQNADEIRAVMVSRISELTSRLGTMESRLSGRYGSLDREGLISISELQGKAQRDLERITELHSEWDRLVLAELPVEEG
jgi:hypothetical protein